MRHRASLRRIQQLGTPVEFVRQLSDYDETTDTYTNDRIIVVKGHAVELDGDAIEYRDYNLAEKNPVTLFFIPDTIDDEPVLESQIKWANKVRTVRFVFPFRPSGHGIGAKVIAT
jgi:hypothetical protein